MVIDATSPVHFHLSRDGGAVIGVRLTLWRGVGGANPEMAASVDFADPVPREDDRSVVLPADTYTCVMSAFVHKALNTLYRFQLQADGTRVFESDITGDLNDEPHKAALIEAQFDIHVTA
jgi:hypothetical protein